MFAKDIIAQAQWIATHASDLHTKEDINRAVKAVESSFASLMTSKKTPRNESAKDNHQYRCYRISHYRWCMAIVLLGGLILTIQGWAATGGLLITTSVGGTILLTATFLAEGDNMSPHQNAEAEKFELQAVSVLIRNIRILRDACCIALRQAVLTDNENTDKLQQWVTCKNALDQAIHALEFIIKLFVGEDVVGPQLAAEESEETALMYYSDVDNAPLNSDKEQQALELSRNQKDDVEEIFSSPERFLPEKAAGPPWHICSTSDDNIAADEQQVVS